MALLFMDSFDHYQTADIAEKWTQVCTIDPGGATNVYEEPAIGAYGRNSTRGVRETSNRDSWACCRPLGLTLTPSDTDLVIVGMAVKYSGFTALYTGGDPRISQPFMSYGTNWLLAIRDTNTYQVFFEVNTNGTISCYRGNSSGSTLLGTTSVALQIGVWAYVEFKVLIHPSTGTVDVRIGGVNVLSLTGQNTRTSSNSVWNEVRIGFIKTNGAQYTLDVDDLVVMDGSGSFNNDFIGDVTIGAIYPNGAGASTGWTPSTGSNYQCVDEAQVNDDTDYVSASTNLLKDLYDFTDAAVGADIRGVQLLIAARKAAEGPGKLTPVVRSNAADYDQTEKAIGGTSYSFLRTVVEVDPATSALWTESGFNAAQFGVKKTG